MSDATVEQLLRDLRAVVGEAEHLLGSAEGGERLKELRAKAEGALGAAREKLSGLEGELGEGVRNASREADAYVHEHPWMAVAAALGLGLVVGLLVARR
jgi:ElaB/YqjD/DUF883 family membrane-anchored ribosome-binding protein